MQIVAAADVNTNAVIVASPMSADEARKITDAIRQTGERLCLLLLEARDREAWRALGYPSWRAYAQVELRLGQSQVYRLLDHGRVLATLAKATDSPVGEISLTEREARAVKPVLPAVIDVVKADVINGATVTEAIATAVKAVRSAPTHYLNTRKRSDRSNRIVEVMVVDAENLTGDVNMIDFADLDASKVNSWAETLRAAAKAITKFADRLEREGGRH